MRSRVAIIASHPIQYQAPLFRALARRPELVVEVFFLSDDGLKEYRDSEFGIDVKWDIDLVSGYKSSFLMNWSWSGAPPPFRRVNPGVLWRLRGFDVILLHGWNSLSNWAAIGVAGVRGVPCLLRGETNGLHEPSGVKGWIRGKALSVFFRPVKGFLAIGSLNRRFYEGHGVSSEQIFHTPYAIENERFMATDLQRDCARAEICSALGIEGNPAIILFTGKFVSKKRPLDLLEAFAQMESQRVLIFVGDGELGSELKEFVASRNCQGVYFVGFKNQGEIPRYYQAADVVAVPSGNEMWGLVVNEAMAAGAAIVASDAVGAAVDLVQDGENGFIFPVGDTSRLAACLDAVVHDRMECRRMGLRSQEFIKNWSISVCVDEIVRAVKQVSKDT